MVEFSQLAAFYPINQEEWNIPHPSLQLGSTIRANLRQRFAKFFAGLDLSRKLTCSRTGVSLRHYLPGDSLRALSLRQWQLQDELLVRTDYDEARQHIGILVHTYSNLTFQGASATNKGQVALAVAGLLELLHLYHGHQVSIFYVSSETFTPAATNILSQKRAMQRWYVISDFLFNAASENASYDSALEALEMNQAHDAILIQVRDPQEWDSVPGTRKESSKLRPFGSRIQANENYFCDGQYVERIQHTFQSFTKHLQSTRFRIMNITERTPVEELLNMVLLSAPDRRKQ